MRNYTHNLISKDKYLEEKILPPEQKPALQLFILHFHLLMFMKQVVLPYCCYF